MSLIKKQKKTRILRINQKRNVKIAKFICNDISIENLIVHTSKLRHYFVISMIKKMLFKQLNENKKFDVINNVENIKIKLF